MPDHAPDRPAQRNAAPAAVLFAACAVLALLALVLATSVAPVVAQQDATAQPTSEFSLILPPTPAPPPATLDPQMLPSVSGVGGRAANASVIIRSGPGLGYRQISYLKHDSWIDIVGWNGWEDEDRGCSAYFENDLDMWVQVQFGERRGWIARCVLEIRGELLKLPIVTETGERILQQ